MGKLVKLVESAEVSYIINLGNNWIRQLLESFFFSFYRIECPDFFLVGIWFYVVGR